MTRGHVLVDARFLGTGTGLDRYTVGLVSALLERDDDLRYTLVVREEAGAGVPAGAARLLVADVPHYSVGEQVQLPRLIAKAAADVALFPHFNAPALVGRPFVVTVHDLTLHEHPGDAGAVKRAAYRATLRTALTRASAVIAVSRFTAGQLREAYGARVADRTTVTGEGVDPQFRPAAASEVDAVRSRLALTRDWLVYVGNGKPHKNVGTLVGAYRRSGVDADLLLVSGDPAVSGFEGDGVRVLRGLDDDTLVPLYTGARAFVTASLAEGYCLPVAEALACGCPVVASNRGAIPEAARGDAMLVEPTETALAEALAVTPARPQRREPERWADVADRTVGVLERWLHT